MFDSARPTACSRTQAQQQAAQVSVRLTGRPARLAVLAYAASHPRPFVPLEVARTCGHPVDEVLPELEEATGRGLLTSVTVGERPTDRVYEQSSAARWADLIDVLCSLDATTLDDLIGTPPEG